MRTKTMKYTTLKGLLKAMSKYSQFSLNTLRSGRMCHKKHSWVRFKLSSQLKREVEDLFKGVIGNIYLYGGSSVGLFDRLIIGLRDNKVYCQYIAGQHYPSELRYLKGLLKWAQKKTSL